LIIKGIYVNRRESAYEKVILKVYLYIFFIYSHSEYLNKFRLFLNIAKYQNPEIGTGSGKRMFMSIIRGNLLEKGFPQNKKDYFL